MKFRKFLIRFFLRLGGFIQSLAVVVLPPRDLLEFNRQVYSTAGRVETFSNPDYVDSGLNSGENDLLSHLPSRKGELLLLGMGGGREAIALAKKGFTVTGIDFIPEMVKQSEVNARRHGIVIDALVQDVNGLDFQEQRFDVIWAGFGQYSTIPTRKRRTFLATKITTMLKPGGYFVCQFYIGKPQRYAPIAQFIRFMVAMVCCGNLWYEKGDMLWGNSEFLHAFPSIQDVKNEVEPCGFKLIHSYDVAGDERGGVVFEKILK